MTYPTSIKSFSFKRNNIDKVIADDVNSAYTEITEIQRQLGGVVSGGIGVTTSTWGTGTFGTTISNWLSAGRDGLAERLANIEAGLYEVLGTGSTFAKTNTTQTFTGTQSFAGQSTQYPVALEIRESTHATSRRAGITFGDVVESWTIGQDSEGNGTRDFFIYGGTTPQKARLKISPDGTINIGTLAAGTGSTAPLKFSSGTNLSTLQSGTIEYDGNVFYATPKVNNTTAGRGLLPTDQVIVLNSNYTPSTLTGIPNETVEVSNSAFNKSIYLAASQAYFVDMSIVVYHNLITLSSGSSSVTFSMSAPTSSTCHITAISTLDTAAITGGTATIEFFTGNISGNSENVKTIASSTSDTGYSILKWSGIIYIGTTAGNFTPQFTRSVTSGASASSAQIIVQAGSYCKVTPVGTYASQINIGGWA